MSLRMASLRACTDSWQLGRWFDRAIRPAPRTRSSRTERRTAPVARFWAERVMACIDAAQLELWRDRAIKIRTAIEIFAD
jgi:hypothetical protein